MLSSSLKTPLWALTALLFASSVLADSPFDFFKNWPTNGESSKTTPVAATAAQPKPTDFFESFVAYLNSHKTAPATVTATKHVARSEPHDELWNNVLDSVFQWGNQEPQHLLHDTPDPDHLKSPAPEPNSKHAVRPDEARLRNHMYPEYVHTHQARSELASHTHAELQHQLSTTTHAYNPHHNYHPAAASHTRTQTTTHTSTHTHHSGIAYRAIAAMPHPPVVIDLASPHTHPGHWSPGDEYHEHAPTVAEAQLAYAAHLYARGPHEASSGLHVAVPSSGADMHGRVFAELAKAAAHRDGEHEHGGDDGIAADMRAMAAEGEALRGLVERSAVGKKGRPLQVVQRDVASDVHSRVFKQLAAAARGEVAGEGGHGGALEARQMPFERARNW